MHAQKRSRNRKVVIPVPLDKQVGAGDLVKKVADALKIPHCGRCAERRRRLNRALAFGPRQD